MWIILLEALAALLILVGIVWWTMFSGRRGGERQTPTTEAPPATAQTPASPEAPSGTPPGDPHRPAP